MATLVRAIAIWIGFAGIAIACGFAREIWLTPHLGDLRAHQIGTLAVSTIFFGVCLAALSFLRVSTNAQAWAVGSLWLVATVAFEFGFGHYVTGHPWQRLFADYNVLQGRIWILVLLVTWTGPAVAFKLRHG